MSERTFQIFAPLTFFEKASEDAGKRRRIAGVISTEALDKQGEIIIQKGLDFSPFVNGGWFNDNHSKKTADILGYPDGDVKIFQKGQRLPDGMVATENCSWAEGYLLETPEAERIWNLGNALKKAGDKRRLGFSIEGGIRARQGPGRKVVAAAVVSNVAITNCPVGEGTRLETLAKSLSDESAAISKALTMSGGTPGTSVATEGVMTGDGAGRVLAQQSLEGVTMRLSEDEEEDEDADLEKSDALVEIIKSMSCDLPEAEEIYETFVSLREQNLL